MSGYLTLAEFEALPEVAMTMSELDALPECIGNGTPPPDQIGYRWKTRISSYGALLMPDEEVIGDEWDWYLGVYGDGPDIEDLPIRWSRIVLAQERQ